MRSLILTVLAVCVVSLGSVGFASVAQASDADQVVIVDFDTTDVDGPIMDDLYGHLRRYVSDDASMQVSETGDISMSDLVLMAGCDPSEPACLAMLGDFVDGDRLLFGSVEQRDGTLTISMTLFDFEDVRVSREISEQTVRLGTNWFGEALEGVVEHFMFGKTASLTVTLSDEPEARLRVNGESVGTGSMTVDEVAPGEVVVMAMAPDGSEQTRRLALRHQQEEEVEISFDESVDSDIDAPPVAHPGESGPSLVPGIAVSGVGVASLIFGFVANSSLSSTEDDANDLVTQGLQDSSDAARAGELQSDMDRANTMRFIGWSGGVVGLGAGGFLLVRALMAQPSSAGSASATLSDERTLDFDVGATSDGVNAGIRFDF